MDDNITLEDFVKNFTFEDIKYEKGEDHDQIHTMMPLESNNYYYCLQTNEDVDVKHAVHSLFSAFNDGELDIDYFLEMMDYGYLKKDYEVSNEYIIGDFLASMVRGASKEFSRVTKEFAILNIQNKIVWMTMGRLPSTFQSVAVLIKNGFYYETICLFRVILEQISYSYQCSNSTEEQVVKLQPQSSISELKKLFEKAGVLNGYFSNYIHHSNKIWHDIFDEDYHVISRSGSKSKDNVIFMAVLAEMYIGVLYDIYERFDREELDENFHGLVVMSKGLIARIKLMLSQDED